MDRKRSLALTAFATLFLVAASSTYKLTEFESRSRARRAWLSEQTAQTRELGHSQAYAQDDALVSALSEFMDQSDEQFAEAILLYQKYQGKERDRLARYTCSAIMDWARSSKLVSIKRAAAECAVCDLVTEYTGDATLVGPLFGAAMELQLGDNEYLRTIAHDYVTDPASNRQTAEFISRSFLTNPYARAGAQPPRGTPTKVASTVR